jgi:hypothetical protein
MYFTELQRQKVDTTLRGSATKTDHYIHYIKQEMHAIKKQ